ncbi:polysaccharide deacetylase family protein [Bacillus sp. DX1.1]|uniref:peptidoglycan-N-acetylglucosamine deacetylase n=1 Tax=unclassified Bacillus (in: firmicutes) TaxID=185979 RepID=UPI0025700745|nr:MULTISPECIES: polysaccharide deacetylase family protein [unclassified Bacillus (in: firmicutes)]MDM5154511.1 polysaccharide deacetylase family protein [Bacillus sp. DX1.1]WJE84048.1 polysaccharide deacetylase family protein [Bacillus sp. DX3.1]
MYYFYPPEIWTPFQSFFYRNIPQCNDYFFLSNSSVQHTLYTQNYTNTFPFSSNNYTQVSIQESEEAVRGSWTPFSWVEKYAYAFSGPYNKAEVALTFDDGPDLVYTPQILDKLSKHGVKGTFFLLGENAEKYPEVVKRIVKEGHIVGNHTYSHPNLAKVSDEEYRDQILKTEEILRRLTGYDAKFIRPPYGSINENQLKWATEQNFMMIQWSVDTVDWKGLSAEKITNTVLGNTFPGSILLQHSAPGGKLQGSVDALDRIIPELTSKGARFVTLPKMFDTSKQRR